MSANISSFCGTCKQKWEDCVCPPHKTIIQRLREAANEEMESSPSKDSRGEILSWFDSAPPDAKGVDIFSKEHWEYCQKLAAKEAEDTTIPAHARNMTGFLKFLAEMRKELMKP